MKKYPLFADEKLKDIEKAVYEITPLYGKETLDGYLLLGKLFERGYSFGGYTSERIKKAHPSIVFTN